MSAETLGWTGIVRLGLVQTALGAIVVLTNSTLNRVMVVELAFPAMVPGALVALHYAVQLLRPRWGHGADTSGRNTPWIIGGMAVLALAGVGATLATALMSVHPAAGIALAVVSFFFIGIGVGSAGTALMVLLAKAVDPERRAAAATIVWTMMIAGFVVTALAAGRLLDPFSPSRLIAVASGVAAIAFLLAVAAVWGLERGGSAPPEAAQRAVPFRAALAQVWSEPRARRFAIFVFVSMLAYSAQDLILEPFAGAVFAYTPGQSTQLAGVQHAGVLVGMVSLGFLGSGGRRVGSMWAWTIAGCIASAFALAGLSLAALVGPAWPLRASVFALGVTNGIYAVAAIGSMMELAGSGRAHREGVRMGLWGAAQAIAFGLGGFAGTLASDVARWMLGSPVTAYATVFALEGALFIGAAALAARISSGPGVDTAAELSGDAALYLPSADRG
ncbi:MAG: BCD family MFS transporter [Xanthobacteraceae bacterium]